MCINEIAAVKPQNNNSLNGYFRGKDLGTISSLNEYITFRQAHGIDTKEYKDIYLGDYFKIQDGTYNAVWMVAHFDYYYNKGNNAVDARGVVLIPRTTCGSSKMNNTDTTTGAYLSSIAHTAACPAIASALSTVLGSYLLSNNLLLSNTTNASTASMAGAGWPGASTNWEWVTPQCVLPNEVQIYGSTVYSSSFFDVGEACGKLAVFNFINHVEYSRTAFWLRSVVASNRFALAGGSGITDSSAASSLFALRPLIYVG